LLVEAYMVRLNFYIKLAKQSIYKATWAHQRFFARGVQIIIKDEIIFSYFSLYWRRFIQAG
jgi:hypothetical protein